MTLLVAAIAATVAAIVELTITPFLRVGDAQPHLVFVLAVVWTVAVGLDSGLVWAFVGGLVLDTLAQRPLGTTAPPATCCSRASPRRLVMVRSRSSSAAWARTAPPAHARCTRPADS